MSDIPTPIFLIDRAVFISRVALVEIVRFHLAAGSIVRVEDRRRRSDDRLRYEICPIDGAFQVIDAAGRPIGVFADVAAMVAHAEARDGAKRAESGRETG